MTEADIVQRLREMQADMNDAIEKMDASAFDTGMMRQIRAEQHDFYKEAADEIERLRAEVEALRMQTEAYADQIEGMVEERGALEREVEALRAALAMQPDEPTEESIRWAKDALDRQIEEWQRDAGRYRFMKENLAELLTLCAIAGTNTGDAPGILAGINASRLDAAIDAALAQAKEGA